MSNHTTPKRIDLDDLSVLVHHARNYQEYLEEENRRIAQLEEEKDTRVIELADELEERDKDPRIQAWNEIADHPFFESAYDTEDTLLGAMLAKLDAAMKVTQAIVPRVITADELEEGQTVAAWCNEDGTTGPMAALGVVQWTNGRYVDFRPDSVGPPTWGNIAAEGITIVLLEDAPAEEPEPVKVGDSVRTVAELDGLAHGSVVLDYFDDAHQKADGVWREAARREERDAAGMLTYGPFTVLYLPEEEA